MPSFGYHSNPIKESPENNSAPSNTDNKCSHKKLEDAGQTHVHEFLGSTRIAEEEEDPHNHRFASVTSEVILANDTNNRQINALNHRHGFLVNTDFYEEHHHEITGLTGLGIPVAENRHGHFAEVVTTLDDGHFHEAIFATLIQDPIGE